MIYGSNTGKKKTKSDILLDTNVDNSVIDPKTLIRMASENRFINFLFYNEKHPIKGIINRFKFKRYLKKIVPDFKFLVDVADMCDMLQYLYFYSNKPPCPLFTHKQSTKKERGFTIRTHINGTLVNIVIELVNPMEPISYYGEAKDHPDGIIKIHMNQSTIGEIWHTLYSYEFVNNTFVIKDLGTDRIFTMIYDALYTNILKVLKRYK